MNIVLEKLNRRATLTDIEVGALRETFSSTHTYEAGQDVLVEGEAPTFSGALLEGILCREKLVQGGCRQIVAFPLPGDVFDMQTFMLDRMDHSVTAVSRSRVALASHAAIIELSKTQPRLTRLLWRDGIIEGSIYREWVLNIGRRSAYSRLAHLFCEIYLRMSDVGLAAKGQCAMTLVQSDLADATGLSVVHVNRSLQLLRSEELISVGSGRLAIHDWDGLTEAAGFDEAYLHMGPISPKVAGPSGGLSIEPFN